MSLRDVVTRVVALLADAERLEPEVRQDAAREGRMLVAAVLGLSPGGLAQRLLRRPVVTPAETEAIERALHRRRRGEPLAYAVGSAAFRNLVLQVDARVLIPRPETEVVVGEALRLTADRLGGVAIDVGTGSGAIALSLATEGRFDRVIATDVSADALAVATANAERLLRDGDASVEFRMGADLTPVAHERARVLVANPPYIAYAEAAALPASVRDWEPPLALFAPDDGMARYHALIAGAQAVLEPGGWLVCEVDARRAGLTSGLAESAGWQQVQVVQDLAGRDRVLVAQAPSRGT
jgi:release factor glutamine methyltransferase